MADQVTISTFLELRDHMSSGINQVTEALKKTDTAAKQVTATIDKMGRIRGASGSFLKVGTEAHTAAMKELGKTTTDFGNALVKGASDGQSALGALSESASGLASPLMAAVSAIGGFAAFKTAIDLGRDFENVTIRIAGTLKAFDLAPTFTVARQQAETVNTVIQELAAALPGETEDYVSVFATALPKAIAAGMSDVRKIADFTSRYTAVATSNMVDAQQAGMDLFRMLAGQAGGDVKTWVVLAEKIGMDAKAFNKLSANIRQAKIDQAIKAFDDQLKAAGDTFDAKFGEMQSRLKEIVRLGSAPLFAGVKVVLADINKYLTENKEKLMATVQIIARDFLDGVRKIPSIIKNIGDRLRDIWDYTKLIITGWAGIQLLNGLSAVLTIYNQIKAAAIAINAANVAGGVAGGAAGGAGAIASGLGGKTFMNIAALSAAGLAGAAAFLYSKPAAGTSELDWEKKQKEAQDREIEIRTKYSDILDLMTERTADVPIAIADITGTLAGIYADLTTKMKGPLSGAALAAIAEQRVKLVEYASLAGVNISEIIGIKPIAKDGEPTEPVAAPKARPEQTFDFRHSRFDIKQEFAEGFDPDRIAVAFASDLGRLGDMKLQASYGLAGGVR